MPKVADAGPYRLFFFSNERNEPPHVHVERDDKVANSGCVQSRWQMRAASVAAS
jgi:hypothetical protein